MSKRTWIKSTSYKDPKTPFFEDNTQHQRPNDDQLTMVPFDAKDADKDKDGEDAEDYCGSLWQALL